MSSISIMYRATRRKVAGSIPDVIIGISHWLNSSDRTMALASTQPLKAMSTGHVYWEVKSAGVEGSQLHVPIE
jgi:hypothetical protein